MQGGTVKSNRYAMLVLSLVALYGVGLFGQNKPKDSFGKIDKAEVVVKQVKPNQFSFQLTWDNDEKLAAFSYPLIVKGKDFTMHYDSVSWKGRADYFAVKSVSPKDSIQQVLVGFFADLSGKNPPLAEGKGGLATLYFTANTGKAPRTVDVCDIMVDTVFIAPSNRLYGVTPDGLGEVHPIYNVVRQTAAGQMATCK